MICPGEMKSYFRLTMKHIILLAILICQVSSSSNKTILTLDEFLSYNEILSLSTSSIDNQQYILVRIKNRIWEENRNQYELYMYTTNRNERKLISTNASGEIDPLWCKDMIVYASTDDNNDVDGKHQLNIYYVRSQETVSISIGNEPIHSITCRSDGKSIYYATRMPLTDASKQDQKKKWQGVVEYRATERSDIIHCLKVQENGLIENKKLTEIPKRISELVCSTDGSYLIFSTQSLMHTFESVDDYEIYRLSLTPITLKRLTNNNAIETNLQLSNDHVFFTVIGAGSVEGSYHDTQGRLYSLNIHTLEIQQWAKDFQGNIKDYSVSIHGVEGVILLGQINTEVQIYSQKTSSSQLEHHKGWPGTYQMLRLDIQSVSSMIVFIHSSFDTPQEVYVTTCLEDIQDAQPITSINALFNERNLPQAMLYTWNNTNDKTEIEGILLYPPDKYRQKNLPLLVLIHGGPYNDADLNAFQADWYYCAAMMASAGWLIFQPNYRGTGGYGDRFLNDLLLGMVSKAGEDILFGVDALVNDGIADPNKLNVGGYSFGGYLTNWLITQTTRFNAALSGAAAVETVSDWGMNDEPLVNAYYLGGYPWEAPEKYHEQATIYQMHRIQTPTLILTGDNDIRVPTAQSFIFERALHTLGVPCKLLIFPNEGHLFSSNPWNEKIKIREELAWLDKYGHQKHWKSS